jgi:hypothetical protein
MCCGKKKARTSRAFSFKSGRSLERLAQLHEVHAPAIVKQTAVKAQIRL